MDGLRINCDLTELLSFEDTYNLNDESPGTPPIDYLNNFTQDDLLKYMHDEVVPELNSAFSTNIEFSTTQNDPYIDYTDYPTYDQSHYSLRNDHNTTQKDPYGDCAEKYSTNDHSYYSTVNDHNITHKNPYSDYADKYSTYDQSQYNTEHDLWPTDQPFSGLSPNFSNNYSSDVLQNSVSLSSPAYSDHQVSGLTSNIACGLSLTDYESSFGSSYSSPSPTTPQETVKVVGAHKTKSRRRRESLDGYTSEQKQDRARKQNNEASKKYRMNKKDRLEHVKNEINTLKEEQERLKNEEQIKTIMLKKMRKFIEQKRRESVNPS